MAFTSACTCALSRGRSRRPLLDALRGPAYSVPRGPAWRPRTSRAPARVHRGECGAGRRRRRTTLVAPHPCVLGDQSPTSVVDLLQPQLSGAAGRCGPSPVVSIALGARRFRGLSPYPHAAVPGSIADDPSRGPLGTSPDHPGNPVFPREPPSFFRVSASLSLRLLAERGPPFAPRDAFSMGAFFWVDSGLVAGVVSPNSFIILRSPAADENCLLRPRGEPPARR